MDPNYLIFGNGFLGNEFRKFFDKSKMSDIRITDENSIVKEIEKYGASHVINCVGRTGKPNVDWCESNKEETTRANIVVPTLIALACNKTGARMIHIGSGCIYEGDNNGSGYSEEDKPNFTGSFYSRTKIISEEILSEFPVLQLRIRIPFSGNPHPKNLINKLLKFDKILISPNSMTCIDDLLEYTKKLIELDQKGIFNLVNRGSITYEKVMGIYEELTDTKLKYSFITPDQLDKMTLARRSNCVLSTQKLESLMEVSDIEVALRKSLKRYINCESLL